ncbi:MAG: hypothetical protein KDC42_02280 [Ignavibacteriae bacterium]|nr:hypothetical protein [Ignavibacteriota bacterium]
MDFKDYLNSLDGWMKYWSFEKQTLQQGLEVDAMFYRGRIEGTKFGKVDSYAFIKHVPDNINADWARTYSNNLFEYASRVRSGPPLGFGAMLIVYPLLVVENISNDLYQWSQKYCPKHFAASEFPSILSLTTQDLYYYPKTPIWGALYYSDFRNQSQQCFSPKKWADISARARQ